MNIYFISCRKPKHSLYLLDCCDVSHGQNLTPKQVILLEDGSWAGKECVSISVLLS